MDKSSDKRMRKLRPFILLIVIFICIGSLGVIREQRLRHFEQYSSVDSDETPGRGNNSLFAVPRVSGKNSKNDVVANVDTSDDDRIVKGVDVLPNAIPSSSFACPANYAIQGTDDAWFKKSIIQRSPLSNKTIPVEELPQIVVLSPIGNSAPYLHRYFSNLCSLDYPHHLISIVLGEDASTDSTVEVAQKHAEALRPYFKRIEVVRLRNIDKYVPTHKEDDRHALKHQYTRRHHLAFARNQLMFAGMRDEKWVLWIDSDVKHIPTNIIERLLAVNKKIVVPNCLYRRDDGQTDTYDRNTWKETDESLKFLQNVEPKFLMLEGYGPTKRRFLSDLKEEGDVVKIDGVGGCVLLIEADLHKQGLFFPAFTFEHHIETEGLAKMAAKLEIGIYGLPSVNVIHS